MITITNRDLEETTTFTHPQLKRWAVAFLEVDNPSGQHSGIPRRYNFEQAFRIIMGGYLVGLKFTLIEARQILDDVTGWMNQKRWNIAKCVNFTGSMLSGGYVARDNFPWRELKVDILNQGDGKFSYHAKITIHQKKMKIPNRWQERYDLEFFGDGSIGSIGPVRSIDITPIIYFLKILFTNKGRE